jgi:N-acyl-phosphatidylethanolamine-hydrolysing phospholipase D
MVRRAGSPSPRATVSSATWIGHATVLVQSGGLNILTDPIFSERASPVRFLGPRRAQPPGIPLEDLPPIDVVVISHNHYDHLDRATVVRLNERSRGRTLFLVPLGLKAFLADQGIRNVMELDWWDVHRQDGVEFHLVPVQHWSARGLFDLNRTLWGGWAVFAPDLRWYFAGDTGYSVQFAEARQRLAQHARDGTLFDLALLPIGAYEPRWFMREQHMNPAEAVRAHRELGARHSIGVHWGTFELTDESLDQPPLELAAARLVHGVGEHDFFVLPIGGTWWPAGAPAPDAK